MKNGNPTVALALATVGAFLVTARVASWHDSAPTDEVQSARQGVAIALGEYEKTGQIPPLAFADVSTFTNALDSVAPGWINAETGDARERRRRIVTLIPLEMAATPDMGGQTRLIEWACRFQRRVAPSEFERVWMQASMAVLQRGLFQTDGAPSRDAALHFEHGIQRFPTDARLRLMNILLRPEAFRLSNRQGADPRRLVRVPMAPPGGLNASPARIDTTLRDLLALAPDTEVGPEAQVHAALIYFHKDRLPQSLEASREAARRSDDPFVRNLAFIAQGLVLERQDQMSDAVEAYRAAVTAVPRSQTSAIALANSLFITGERGQAAQLIDTAFTNSDGSPDPWVHVVADYRQLPEYLQRLRKLASVPAGRTVTTVEMERRLSTSAASSDQSGSAPADGLVPSLPGRQGRPLFRSIAASVAVDVSVLQGNQPVGGLRSNDFELFDNGLRQAIETVSANDIPLDVSLIVVTTDWHGPVMRRTNQLEGIADDLPRLLDLLRADDHVRVLTVAGSVTQFLPLQAVGTVERARLPSMATVRNVAQASFGRNYALYDAIASTFVRVTPANRRHLIVVFGSGFDDASITSDESLRKMAPEVDAVLYFARRSSAEDVFREGLIRTGQSLASVRSSSDRFLWPSSPALLEGVADATGGSALFQAEGSLFADLRDILAKYRQSYVIRYQPSGIAEDGWHGVTVRVTRPGNYKVQARKGYFGG